MVKPPNCEQASSIPAATQSPPGRTVHQLMRHTIALFPQVVSCEAFGHSNEKERSLIQAAFLSFVKLSATWAIPAVVSRHGTAALTTAQEQA